MDPPEHLTAAATDNHVRETVNATEGPVLAVRAGMDDAALDELFLHLHEYFTRDNGFVAIFYIILRYDAVVLYSSLCEEVRSIGFLQQGISTLLFVSQNLFDIAGMPFFFFFSNEKAVCFKSRLNFQHAGPFQVF